jgi:alkylhydroperoxidase/carboxymuconolactone decarboxylase family protein YurZ
MNSEEFSAKLMQLSMELQEASKEKQKAFSHLFFAAKQALDNGYTQEEIQIIVVTAIQIGTNPELEQLFSILTGQIDLNPEDDYQ